MYGFEGTIRWYHWFDLEESFEGQVKVNSIFLNGTPYIFLQILVTYLDSFPKHYNPVYCPMDDKNEDIKEAFYQHIEQAYDSTPRNDIKMIIGDMNQPRLGKKRNIKE